MSLRFPADLSSVIRIAARFAQNPYHVYFYLLHDKEEVGICSSNVLDEMAEVRVEMHSGWDVGCLEVGGLEAFVHPL